MKYDAMIIIDMQTALIEKNPYNKNKVLDNIKTILTSCRAHKIPVIYICHDDGIGTELEAGSKGWKVFEDIAPLNDEVIIEKHFTSSFRKTGLKEHLDSIGAKNLILCGMQVEYCFDTTCRVAFEYEYNITIPRGTTTTFDNTLATAEVLCEYYENKIWHNRFAQVVDVDKIIKRINASNEDYIH
ncbi:cysteine hydrolase family protein [Cellulosilyticum sp. I15G10I2]|uniref:cysteine hydrolase family protein n=1 Tax=Cellulosilyticum sp. I15G10I2 TaxID=1892843 RepID=UPI00085BDC24|nr:cysteine hydrolase family protein [Cellulosilyticum sp. I15G10I2]